MRGRRSEMGSRRRARGSALVLAVLILFAMLALGMIAMRSTTQNMAGSGNLRMNKQARYVAEAGLYQAITLMQQDAVRLLALRAGRPRSTLEIDSAGVVRAFDDQGREIARVNRPAGPVLNAPAPLGTAFDAATRVSYRVSVDGFVSGPPLPGYDIEEARRNGQVFCMMQFTARGYVADRALPTAAELNGPEAPQLFAETQLRAAVTLGPFATDGCRRL